MPLDGLCFKLYDDRQLMACDGTFFRKTFRKTFI